MRDFLESGKYLPKFLRDFHDQKRVFLWIDSGIPDEKRTKWDLGWMSAHVYVIDHFLWVMAKCGWTLQRSRQKLEFGDIENNIEEFRQKQLNALAKDIDKTMEKYGKLGEDECQKL